MSKTLAERFWAQVEKQPGDGCWIWRGKTVNGGYGAIKVNRKWRRATHVAWELLVGPLPAGTRALHRCNNPPCVRADVDPSVSHLFPGTHRENMADMVKKGRSDDRRGPRNPAAKLTEEQVMEIRRRYRAGGIAQSKLAAEYGVAGGLISMIVTGKVWGHLPINGGNHG